MAIWKSEKLRGFVWKKTTTGEVIGGEGKLEQQLKKSMKKSREKEKSSLSPIFNPPLHHGWGSLGIVKGNAIFRILKDVHILLFI